MLKLPSIFQVKSPSKREKIAFKDEICTLGQATSNKQPENLNVIENQVFIKEKEENLKQTENANEDVLKEKFMKQDVIKQDEISKLSEENDTLLREMKALQLKQTREKEMKINEIEMEELRKEREIIAAKENEIQQAILTLDKLTNQNKSLQEKLEAEREVNDKVNQFQDQLRLIDKEITICKHDNEKIKQLVDYQGKKDNAMSTKRWVEKIENACDVINKLKKEFKQLTEKEGASSNKNSDNVNNNNANDDRTTYLKLKKQHELLLKQHEDSKSNKKSRNKVSNKVKEMISKERSKLVLKINMLQKSLDNDLKLSSQIISKKDSVIVKENERAVKLKEELDMKGDKVIELIQIVKTIKLQLNEVKVEEKHNMKDEVENNNTIIVEEYDKCKNEENERGNNTSYKAFFITDIDDEDDEKRLNDY